MRNSASADCMECSSATDLKLFRYFEWARQAKADKWLMFFGWHEGCRHIVRPAKFYVGLGFEIKGQLKPPLGYCGGFEGRNGAFRLGEAAGGGQDQQPESQGKAQDRHAVILGDCVIFGQDFETEAETPVTRQLRTMRNLTVQPHRLSA